MSRPCSPGKCRGRQSPGGLSGPSPRRPGLPRSRLSHVSALSAAREFFPLASRPASTTHPSQRRTLPKSAPLKPSALRSGDQMRGNSGPINLSPAEQGPAGENEGDGRMTAYLKCLHRYSNDSVVIPTAASDSSSPRF